MSRKRFVAFIIITTFIILNIFVWRAILLYKNRNLRISFLNVGEGRAVLVQSPTGTRTLIDAGPGRIILRALSQNFSAIDRRIDLVIQTNIDTGSTSGMQYVFDNYHINTFMVSGVRNSTTASRLTARAVGSSPQLKYYTATQGTHINIGGGAAIDVLYIGHTSISVKNRDVLVLRISYGATSFLLPSDLSATGQSNLATLLGNKLVSNVLLVGHYGALNSVSADFLHAVHPSIAIISVGNNSYRYPRKEIIQKLHNANVRVISTRKHGTVTFISNGTHIQEIETR